MGRFWRQADLWLKVFSLLVALVVWFYAASRATPPAEVGWRMSVPLEVRGLASGLVVAGAPPTIDVSLAASPGQESAVKGEVRAILSVEGLAPGHHRLAVRVPQPAVGRVVGVSPRWIELDLGPKGVVRRSVTVELSGTAAAGYQAQPAQAVPAEVNLTGVEGLLPRVAGVRVRVEVDGAKAEIRTRVPAVPVDTAGKPVAGVAVEPAEVEVLAPVSAVAASGGPGAVSGTTNP